MDPTVPEPFPAPPRPISLALQGGGSHGAFTWGVLDTLLQQPSLQFDGVSGASAGAVNAVALAHGFATAAAQKLDGTAARALARDTLARVWRGIAGLGGMGSMATGVARMLLGGWPEAVRTAWGGDRPISPYQTNPLDINPLRKLLEHEIDFAAIAAMPAAAGLPRVFVAATHVATGRAEIFEGARLTLAAVMASACLPLMFQAVEIDGEHYWDGGFSSNPPLSPLVDLCATRDIVLVQINPLRRAAHPHSTHDILDRMNEMTFNSSLLAQMRSIDYVQRQLASGRLQPGPGYQPLRLHRIDGGVALESLPQSSKLSTDSTMIDHLFALGRSAGTEWLAAHGDALGLAGSIDLQRDYLGLHTSEN